MLQMEKRTKTKKAGSALALKKSSEEAERLHQPSTVHARWYLPSAAERWRPSQATSTSPQKINMIVSKPPATPPYLPSDRFNSLQRKRVTLIIVAKSHEISLSLLLNLQHPRILIRNPPFSSSRSWNRWRESEM